MGSVGTPSAVPQGPRCRSVLEESLFLGLGGLIGDVGRWLWLASSEQGGEGGEEQSRHQLPSEPQDGLKNCLDKPRDHSSRFEIRRPDR